MISVRLVFLLHKDLESNIRGKMMTADIPENAVFCLPPCAELLS